MAKQKLFRNHGTLTLEQLTAVAGNHAYALNRLQWVRIIGRLAVRRRLVFYVWALGVTAALAYLLTR